VKNKTCPKCGFVTWSLAQQDCQAPLPGGGLCDGRFPPYEPERETKKTRGPVFYVAVGPDLVEHRASDGKPLRSVPLKLFMAAPEMAELLRDAGDWYCGELSDGTDRREAIRALLSRIDDET